MTFKVGDRVRHRVFPEWGPGEVLEKQSTDACAYRVNWNDQIFWCAEEDLELVTESGSARHVLAEGMHSGKGRRLLDTWRFRRGVHGRLFVPFRPRVHVRPKARAL